MPSLKVPLRNFVRSRGFDLIKTPNLHTFLASRGVDMVIDVGGNEGGYGRYLRRWGYRGGIHSIEPSACTFARLKANIAGDPNWTAEQSAAGCTPGKMVLNISRDDRFSSFNGLTAEGVAFDPGAEVVKREAVRVVLIDDVAAELPGEAVFLKVDTQGFERQVLDGASCFLQRCVGVQLELPVQQLYEGVWSFEEAIADMRVRGFMLSQLTPTNPRHDDPASVCEFDAVFRRILICPPGSSPRPVAMLETT